MILETINDDTQSQVDTDMYITSEDMQPQAEKVSQTIVELQPEPDFEIVALSENEKTGYIIILEEGMRILKEEMAVIVNRFNQSKSENEKLRTEKYNSEEEIYVLKNTLHNKETEIEKLSLEINSNKARLKLLTDDFANASLDAKESKEKLQQEVQSLNSKIKKLLEEIKYFKKDNNELVVANNLLQAECTSLNSKLKRLTREVKELSLDLQTVTEMNSTLQSKNLMLEHNSKALTAKIKDLQIYVKDLEEEISNSKTSSVYLEVEKEKAVQAKIEAESKINSLEQEKKDLKTALDTANAQKEKAEQVQKELEAENLNLKNKLEMVQKITTQSTNLALQSKFALELKITDLNNLLKSKQENLNYMINALKKAFIANKSKGFKYKFKKLINFICKKLFNKEPFNLVTWGNIATNEQFKQELAQHHLINDLKKEIVNLKEQINDIEHNKTVDDKIINKSNYFNTIKELVNCETSKEIAEVKPVKIERVIN